MSIHPNEDALSECSALLKKHSKAPNWSTRYRIGVLLNQQMDHVFTLEEVAAEMGITKQNAYTETVLALGSLACGLHRKLVPIDQQTQWRAAGKAGAARLHRQNWRAAQIPDRVPTLRPTLE